jgi:hypothetical protein
MVLPTAATKIPQINAAVAKVLSELSPGVRRIRYEFGEDWTGQPVIFFRVLLSDEAATRDNLRRIAPLVESRITDECYAFDLGLFPHFNFRSEEEQAKAHEPAWA